jgi:hypothetical protein
MMTQEAAISASVEDIALLIGVPVDYEEFEQRIKTSDWLSKFYDRGSEPALLAQSVKARWEQEYSPLVADGLQKLLEIAEKLNIQLFRSATIEALGRATQTKQVVILFAHWKGPEILNDDFIVPPNATKFAAEVHGSESPLADWLRSRFSEIETSNGGRGLLSWSSISRALRRTKRPVKTVREVLNDALHTPLVDNNRNQIIGVDEVLEHNVSRSARRRDEIDRLFASLLRPGNRLELFDGLHSKEQIEAAIAPTFGGILDLTTCTSTVLADHISKKRHKRLRTVQFASVQEFLWCANCVAGTLQLVANGGMSYQSARVTASAVLEESIKELSQNPKRSPHLH